MSINFLHEETLPLAEAARRLPALRDGRPVHISTLWRWTLKGVRGVRLESAKIGGVRVTSIQALQRFVAALNQNSNAVAEPIQTDDEAQRLLDRLGIR